MCRRCNGTRSVPTTWSVPRTSHFFVRQAAGAQEIDERFELGGREVPKLNLMALADRFIQLLKQGEAGLGDADLHDAAIVGHSLAHHEPAFCQPIQEPSDIRGVRNQPRCQRESRQSRRMLGPEQPQGVILLGSQFVLREELVLKHPQAVVCPPEAEINLLLG